MLCIKKFSIDTFKTLYCDNITKNYWTRSHWTRIRQQKICICPKIQYLRNCVKNFLFLNSQRIYYCIVIVIVGCLMFINKSVNIVFPPSVEVATKYLYWLLLLRETILFINQGKANEIVLFLEFNSWYSFFESLIKYTLI